MRKTQLSSGISSFTLKLLSAVIFATLMSTLCRAQQSVTLAWDPNSEPDLAGYNLYYGASSGNYPNTIGVRNNTTGTISGLVQGATYFFVVTAYNSSGLESDPSNEISYLVPSQPANLPPVANAQSLTTGQNTPTVIVLTGIDPEGGALTVAVLTPPFNGTLSGTAPSLTYTPNLNFNGADSFSFKVNDGLLDSVPTTVAITVTPVNLAPSVSIISPFNNGTFAAPANINIMATVSDSDGSISKAEFFQGATLLSTVTTSPYLFNWTGVPKGTYSLTVRATDDSGAVTTSGAITVNVIAPPNVPPVVSLGSPANNAVFNFPANIAISATASDSDGTVVKVDFFQGMTLLASDSSSPYTFNWAGVLPGTYSLTAKATDNLGAVSVSSIMNVTVVAPPNIAPSASLISPANNATFTAPATVTIAGTATDTDGSIAKVDFFAGTTLLGTAATSPYVISWSAVPLGTYNLTAKATDNSGAVTTSSPITIMVIPPPNVAPTASLTTPLSNAMFTAPASIAITAAATDSDGTVSKVDFFQGTTLLGTAISSPYAFSWTGVGAGNYSIIARATDNSGAITTSSPVNLTVNPPPNLPPTINLTAPVKNSIWTAPAGVLVAANAVDIDGTITKVEFFEGPTLLSTATTSPYNFTWSNVSPGTYSLTAKATDNSGAATGSTPVTITVNAPPNVPPVVSLGTPQNNSTFTAPANISLSATATDSDGTVSKVQFFQGTTVLGMVTNIPYTFTWPNVPVGTYSFTVKATDNSGAMTISSAVSVTVNPPPNLPPTVSLTAPINNATFTAPASVPLRAAAFDSDGTVSKVEFFQGTTLLATVTTTPYTFNWTGVPTGTYNLTAKARDNSGAVITSIPVSVTVNPPLNVQPTVSLSSPINNSTFTAPANITLSANSVDLDGTITKVEFFQGSTFLGVITSSPYNFDWLNTPSGAYSLTAKSTDNSGAVTTSTAITVIVNPPPNVPPAVSLSTPPNNATFAAPASISVTATTTDTDGTIGKVEFFQGTTLLGTVTSSPYILNWTGVPAGAYSLTARATDNSGAVTLSGPRSITVIPPANVPPSVSLTAPANNGISAAPANITVSAIASDSDGTITKVEFFKGTTLLGTVTSSPYTFNWSNVSAGTYNLTARATDDSNATTMSTSVQITVNAPANVPPTVSVVNPANNTSLTAPGSVAISATATDPDGTITKVQFFQGTSLLGTAVSSPYTVNWTNIPVGTYSLTAAATDSSGAVAISGTVILIVNPPANLAPLVNVTSPVNNATFSSPANISISANASDADGTINRVEFFQGASLLGVVTTSPYTFNWSNAPVGTYLVTAKAIDNSGAATLSSAVTLTINPRANVPPTVNLVSPPNNATSTAPGSVTVSAQATDTDGTIAKVQFFQGTTLLATLTGSPYTFSWTGVQVGSYLFTAKATDNSGAITTSPTVAFMVNPPTNQPPAVSIVSPLSNATFTAPGTVKIAANASDSDGSISKVDFFEGTIHLGTATSTPYLFDWSNVPTGTYSLTAKATDDSGAISSSRPINVTVNPAPNVPPTILVTSPVNNATFIAPARLAMSATASDSDGAIVKVDFFQGTTLLATATSSPYTFTWTGVPIGTYSLTARATDNSGAASISPALIVTVNPPANVVPTVSLTSPIYNTTFMAPAYISLSASASDSDGTISRVDFFQGTTLLGSATSAPYTISWPNVTPGPYSLTVRASDNSGAVTISSAVAITVTSPPNVAPVINVFSPADNAIFTAPASITLSAMANDSDGTIDKVEFFRGTTLVGTVTNSPYTFTWSAVPVGTYTLTAEATDNFGAVTSSTPITLIVNPPANFAPSVALTSPLDHATFNAPASVTLFANATDSDGSINKVEFFQGTTLLGVVSSSPYTFNWTGVPAGSYNLTARATDNSGAATVSSTTSLIVGSPANVAPVISITSPFNTATFVSPASIAIGAIASDSDGTVSKVEFFQGTSLLGIATTSPYTFNWLNVPAGIYSITAKATDNSGAITISSLVNITVKAPINSPPTVRIISPADNATFISPTSVTISTSAADSDGTIAKVEFFVGTTLLGANTASPYTFNWLNVPPGVYSLTARATDNLGAVTTSSVVTIDVNPPGNVLPKVSILSPANNATFIAGAGITIFANASDSDGTIKKVDFFEGTILLATVAAAPYIFTWSGVPIGTYRLTAKATDNSGAVTASAAVNIIVNPAANVPPTVTITSPLNNVLLNAPADVTITADAFDLDGTIGKVEFFSGTTLLATVTSSPYTFTWDQVAIGAYDLTARATDNSGGVTISSVATISVSPPANVLPTVSMTSPVNNGNLVAPADMIVAANAWDSDGRITKVEFFQGTTLLGAVTSSPYTFAWNNVPTASYILTARATDDSGGISISSPITIHVSGPANAPPHVSITNPTNNATYTAPASIAISADAFDADGSISKVQFFLGPTLLGTATNSPYAFTWSSVPPGTYTLTARATDNSNALTKSAAVTVTVSDPPVVSNNPPVAVAQSIDVIQDTPINITLRGYDPNGDNVTFVVLSAPVHGTLSGVVPDLLYTPNTGYQGIDSFSFTLSDGSLDSSMADVFINVIAASAAPPPLTTQLTRDAGGNSVLYLHLDGRPGMICYLQISSNLGDWTTVATGQAGQPLDYYDSQIDSRSSYFYRSILTDGSLTPTGRSNNGTEINAVGYVKLALQPGFSLIANPFNARSNAVGALLPRVPEGTTLYKLSNGAYSINSFEFGAWSNPEQTLEPGEGAFIHYLGNSPLLVTFLGQVTQGHLINSLPAGYSIISSQVPQAGVLDTNLGFPVDDGDTVYLYNNASGTFATYTYDFGVWNTSPSLSLGQSFIVRKTRSHDWIRFFSFGTAFTK